MKGVDVDRWRAAQIKEKDFHVGRKIIKSSSRHWFKYIRLLAFYTNIDENSSILDVGCGPDAMVSYVIKGERVGLDPLMDAFLRKFKLPKDVHWIKGMGEHMPLKTGYFDVVLCMNVLDHMLDPSKALNEISKILKNEGIFLLYVECHSPFVKYFRKIKETLKVGDIFHPFSFSAEEILKNLSIFNLHLLYIEKEQTKWLIRLITRLKEKNLKAFISLTVRCILSLVWRQMAHIRTPIDDDGMFIFISRKRGEGDTLNAN